MSGSAQVDSSDKVNILLVDDQPARLLTYQSVLGELGQNLVSAGSGIQALERLMQDEFAVVLMDVSMPDMDGFEAARLIHDHPRFERTPIIFVTGVHVSELDRLKGYKLGAVDYVSIPVVPEILRSKVAVLVELYCKRRELRELNRNLARANEQLAQTNATLQAEKNRELETLNATLQHANRDLAHANAELERANFSLHREVAERARAEQALHEADRNKDEFLAMLAHELRNPLAPILNAVQLMRMQPTEQQLAWAQDLIRRQLADLTRLVDDLLDVSRITRGKITLAQEPIELATLIRRAVETVQPLVQERGHELALEIAPEALKVSGDPMRLTQAISNVLGNAAKYTEPGGHIRLACRECDGHAELVIRDDGIGIPPELLPRIFDLFTQLDRRSGHASSGLGIGLALVRRLVEMHGGSVNAQSAGEGTGSEFVIRLPLLLAASVSVMEKKDDGPAAEQPAVARRILVADDNPDALESLVALLNLGGHTVYSAANGALAVESAAQHLPEIALLDIGMPILDGYEVARRIRAQPWGKAITLVALTGWGQDADRRRSHEAGFDSHLVKPLDLDKLTQLLMSLPARAEPERAELRA